MNTFKIKITLLSTILFLGLVNCKGNAKDDSLLPVLSLTNYPELDNSISQNEVENAQNKTNTSYYSASISASVSHSCMGKVDGTVACWGKNDKGQLGNGKNTDSNVPLPVLDLTEVISVSTGESFSIALKANGSVWAWGANESGQLGDGTFTSRNVPALVKDLTNVTSISARGKFAIALKKNGSVWAWGDNTTGQLGNGTNIKSNVAVTVQIKSPVTTNLSSVLSISAGETHALALKSDGTVWAWGANDSGQLGDGSKDSRNKADQIKDLSFVSAVSAGFQSSFALSYNYTTNTSELYAWGNNSNSQLGIGTNINALTPKTIAFPTDFDGDKIPDKISFLSIRSGKFHTLARILVLYGNLTSDPEELVFTWGANESGQFGNATNSNADRPLRNDNLIPFYTLSAGDSYTLGIKNDDSGWAWGKNNVGQLGIGNTTNQNVPVKIADSISYGATPSGSDHSYTCTIELGCKVSLFATDKDSDQICFNITQPKNGTVTTTNNNCGKTNRLGKAYITVQYTPKAGFSGIDIISFFAYDEFTTDKTANTTTVDVSNFAPKPGDTSFTCSKNTSCVLSLVASDTDSSEVCFTITTPPTNGSIIMPSETCVAPNPNYYDIAVVEVTYTPKTNFTGEDYLYFQVKDQYATNPTLGSVKITVK